MKPSAWLVLLSVLGAAHALSWQAEIFYSFSDAYWTVLAVCITCFFFGYGPLAWTVRNFGAVLLVSRIAAWGLSDSRAHTLFLSIFWVFFLLNLLDRFLLLGPGFFLPSSIMQYRIMMTIEGGESAIKGLSIGNFFLFQMPAYLIAFRRRFSVPMLVAVGIAVLLNIYLSSARSALFVSALTAFYFWVIPKKVNLKIGLRVGLIGLALVYGFELIGAVVGKASGELSLVVYAAAPLHAFDAVLGGAAELDGFFLSFYPLHSLLKILFGMSPATELPNIFTPLPTNVYSMFGVYFIDYGKFGLWVAMAIIGTLSGTLDGIYRKTGFTFLRAWCAINMTVLTLSIFYDYYTTSGVIWMSLILSPFFFTGQDGRQSALRRAQRICARGPLAVKVRPAASH